METQNETTSAVIGKAYPETAISEIKAASNSIKIIVFDWRWYPEQHGYQCQQFNTELLAAKKRGLEIKAITNSQEIIKILNQNGIKAKKLYTSKLVHVKMIIFDNMHVLIGSHNFSQNAFTINLEASVLIKNCKEAGKFVDFFNSLY